MSLGDTATPTAASSAHKSSAEVSSPCASPSLKSVKQSEETDPVLPVPPLGSQPKSKEITPQTTETAEIRDAVESKPTAQTDASVVQETTLTNDSTTTETLAPPTKPKLWTGLFGSQSQIATKTGSVDKDAPITTDSSTGELATDVLQLKGHSDLLAGAIRSYQVGTSRSLSYIEPRGLTNRGNICYMNSVSCIFFLTFWNPFVHSNIDDASRYYKFFFFVARSMIFWTKSARKLFTVLKAIPLSSMLCRSHTHLSCQPLKVLIFFLVFFLKDHVYEGVQYHRHCTLS
jgi:hypothetical protein